MNPNEFKGKIVLVTGAAQGIGAAVAQAFSEQGARVAAVDVQKAAIETFASNQTNHGHDVTLIRWMSPKARLCSKRSLRSSRS
jgi:NAD(P)-dependent dehydrogenase (short-subunit alcohol dehydrogenase family)